MMMVVVPGWGGGSGNKGPDDSMTLSAGAVKQPVFSGLLFPHFARELSLALSPQERFLPLLCSAPAARDKRHPLRGWFAEVPRGGDALCFQVQAGFLLLWKTYQNGRLSLARRNHPLVFADLVVVNAAGPPPSPPGLEILPELWN